MKGKIASCADKKLFLKTSILKRSISVAFAAQPPVKSALSNVLKGSELRK